MADENKKETGIDLNKILLPKKEGPSPASAQRVNAGKLLEQEQQAAAPRPPSPASGQGGNASESGLGAKKPAEEELMVKPLQTYRGAIEQAIQKKNVSVVSIAAAEAERRALAGDKPKPAPQPQAESSHELGVRIAAIAGGVLLITGALALIVFVFFQPQATAPVQSTPQSPFIAVDATELVVIAPNSQRNQTMTVLESAREGVALSLGLMARLYVAGASTSTGTPPPTGVQALLSHLSPEIPGELLRSLSGEYLLGVHSFDDNQAFLVLGVESYEAAYAGMLEWEWMMQNDLAPLFVRTPRPRIPEEGIATSTATSTSPQLLRTKFIDRIVENHDARVIQDENGDLLLLWTFLARDTLVITTNEYTLREIISRLARPPVISL